MVHCYWKLMFSFAPKHTNDCSRLKEAVPPYVAGGLSAEERQERL